MRFFILVGLIVAVGAMHGTEARAQAEPNSNTQVQEGTSDASPKLDLNTAGQSALESLSGIGPRTAQLIVEYRTERGGFKKVEELMNVKCIGEKTFLRLRELVRVIPDQARREK